MIAENGVMLAEALPFQPGLTVSELDLQLIAAERQRMTTYPPAVQEGYLTVDFPWIWSPRN